MTSSGWWSGRVKKKHFIRFWVSSIFSPTINRKIFIFWIIFYFELFFLESDCVTINVTHCQLLTSLLRSGTTVCNLFSESFKFLLGLIYRLVEESKILLPKFWLVAEIKMTDTDSKMVSACYSCPCVLITVFVPTSLDPSCLRSITISDVIH